MRIFLDVDEYSKELNEFVVDEGEESFDDTDFKGYDYEELAERWGLKEEIQNLRDAVEFLDDLHIINDFCGDITDAVAVQVLTRFINDCCEWIDGQCVLDQGIKDDIIEYLESMATHEYCTEGRAMRVVALMDVADDEDDHDFVQWFTHCLPLLWT